MGKTTHNYEAICFSLYFSLKYNFEINDISADEVISSDSCLFKFFAFLYYKVHNNSDEKKKLKEHAFFLSSNDDDFNRNWLFVYEALPQSLLKKGEWQSMKKAGISFIKNFQ